MTLTRGGRHFYAVLTLLLLGSMFPVSEPVEKYEGKLQSTGEAKYVDDIPRGEPADGVGDILGSNERQSILTTFPEVRNPH